MSQFYMPTEGPESWRAGLAEPDRQWVRGYSARALAHAWESADGFPERVRACLRASSIEALRGLEIVAAFPEHQVPLPGGSRPSQTDLLVVAKGSSGHLVVIAVEGKVSEPFGPMVSDWDPTASPGRAERFGFLCDSLGIAPEAASHLRYQLLHRTVSAMLEARRFNASAAVMLVHSFSQEHAHFGDYSHFVERMGGEPALESAVETKITEPIPLYLGWVTGDPKFLDV